MSASGNITTAHDCAPLSVDLRRSVPLRIAHRLAPCVVPGDAEALDDGHGVWGYALACPGCGALSLLFLRRPEDRAHAPRWTVTEGDVRTGAGLSLSPSIHHEPPRGCGWDGWLRGDVFVPHAPESP